MSKNQNVLEKLIRLSGENTEELLQTYFEVVNGSTSDGEVLRVLESVSKRLNEMEAEIKFQLKTVKKHR